MKNLNTGLFIWLFVGFTAIVWAIAAYFTSSFPDAWKMGKLISTVVSVDDASVPSAFRWHLVSVMGCHAG